MNKTKSIIQVEESRRVVMLEPQSEEGSTMISINTGGKEAKSNDDGQIVGNESEPRGFFKCSKPIVWCNYCKEP